jgi:hypothetical protein
MAAWSWPATVKVHQHLQGAMNANDAVNSEAQTLRHFLTLIFSACVSYVVEEN